MNELNHSRLLVHVLPHAGLLLVLTTLGAGSLAAQTPRSPMDLVSPRDREISDRELVLRDAERRPPTSNEARLKLAVIKDAFRRLQNSNNELRSVAGGARLDYDRVAEMAHDVRKQADRLRSSLALPSADAERNAQVHDALPSDAHQLLATIIDLDRALQSFVTNEMFRDLKVNDQRLAAQARRDLDAVSDISARISRAAKRLGKTAASVARP